MRLAMMAMAAALLATPARAEDRLNVVASFSILSDFVKNVGGDKVNVTTLVGPNGDVHVYTPAPDDARKVALREARVVVYQVVIALFPKAPFAPELRDIVKRRIEMWAWLDAVNLNSVAGYQAFQKLYGDGA